MSCFDTTRWSTTISDVRERNKMLVWTNKPQTLVVNNEEIPLDCLKDRVKLFLTNPNDDEHLPEKVEKEWEDGTRYHIPKGVIYICTDCCKRKGHFYRQVLTQIHEAFDELKDEYAYSYYQKSYSSLEGKQKEFVDFLIPEELDLILDDRFLQCVAEEIPPPPVDSPFSYPYDTF